MEDLVLAFPSVAGTDHVVEEADSKTAAMFAAMMLRMGYGLETDGCIILRWPNKDDLEDLSAVRRWKEREASDGLLEVEFDPTSVRALVKELRARIADAK
jgi:hypothetical protein